MSGALSKIRDSRKQPERQRSALEYIRDTVAGANKRYWDRQGMLSREGLAQADLGARQVREGNIPMGLVNALLGPVNYVSSPITALVPTQEEIYDAPEIPGWMKPAAAGAAMTAAMFTPGPKVKATKIGGEVADAAEEGITAYHGSPHTFDFSTPSAGTREAVVGDTTITYGVGKGGLSEVTLVKTPKAKRGQGSARAAMEAMIREADAAGMRLGLSADPMDKGVSKAGLVKFYESLGFKRNAGNRRDFTTRAEYIREPKK